MSKAKQPKIPVEPKLDKRPHVPHDPESDAISWRIGFADTVATLNLPRI